MCNEIYIQIFSCTWNTKPKQNIFRYNSVKTRSPSLIALQPEDEGLPSTLEMHQLQQPWAQVKNCPVSLPVPTPPASCRQTGATQRPRSCSLPDPAQDFAMNPEVSLHETKAGKSEGLIFRKRGEQQSRITHVAPVPSRRCSLWDLHRRNRSTALRGRAPHSPHRWCRDRGPSCPADRASTFCRQPTAGATPHYSLDLMLHSDLTLITLE